MEAESQHGKTIGRLMGVIDGGCQVHERVRGIRTLEGCLPFLEAKFLLGLLCLATSTEASSQR